jgi:hypothetical protein
VASYPLSSQASTHVEVELGCDNNTLDTENCLRGVGIFLKCRTWNLPILATNWQLLRALSKFFIHLATSSRTWQLLHRLSSRSFSDL